MRLSHFPLIAAPCVWNNLIFMYPEGTKCCQSNGQHSSPQTKTKGSAGHITGPQEIAFQGSDALCVCVRTMGAEGSWSKGIDLNNS